MLLRPPRCGSLRLAEKGGPLAALRERDWRAALATVGAVGAAAGSVGAFARAGVEQLSRLVASEITTLSICDLASGRREVIGAPAVALSAEDRACFDRHFRGHPLVRYHAHLRGPDTHRISDSVPFARFRESALYAEYYRRIGIDHAVAVPLAVDERVLVSFVLNRRGRDFADCDCALLDAVRGHLAQLYRHAAELERARDALAGLEAALSQGGEGVVLRLQAGRTLLDAAPAALALLARYGVAPVHPGRRLPARLDRWLAGRGMRFPRSLVVEHGGDRLVVRAYADPRSPDGGMLLLVAETLALTSPARFADLPQLTPREREVLRWVAAGKTDRDIAVLLGISVRTVQKHLERCYAALGVETRTAAVMRALGGTLH